MDQAMQDLLQTFKRELRACTYLDQFIFVKFDYFQTRLEREELAAQVDRNIAFLEAELEKRGG